MSRPQRGAKWKGPPFFTPPWPSSSWPLPLIGTCAYLVGFALPLPSNLPLMVLALVGLLVVALGPRHKLLSRSHLQLAVLAFLLSVGLSTLVSADIGRSLQLSTALLPGVLLFIMVADHFESLREIRLLYFTLSVVALGLAVLVLWAAAWEGPGGKQAGVVIPPGLGISILVVPNDLTFLAVVAPLSLVLLYREPRSLGGLLAGLSIFVSMCAICVFQIRTAALTIVLCLICTSILVQPRSRLLPSLAGVVALLLLSLLINALIFPDSQLMTKFVRDRWTLSGRDAYWATAWAMFLHAPLFGQGPHTFGLFHRPPWVHNLFLEILAEQGIVGLAAFGALLGAGVFAAWRVQQAATAEARLFGAGALAGLVGFCIAGGVELTLLREWVVTILFTLLGIMGNLAARQVMKARVNECIG